MVRGVGQKDPHPERNNKQRGSEMNREEALRQIEEINNVIESSHRFFLSGTLAIAYGVAILLIPIIELTTQELTFGMHFGALHLAVKSLIHVIVYFSIFQGLRLFVEKKYANDVPKPSHPLLVHALAFHRPIVLACCGTIIVLGSLDLEPLIPAYILVFFGVLFNFYGRLSNRFVLFLSYTYIVAGLVLAYCMKFQNPNLWMWFSSYLGISFIALGIHALAEKKKQGHE